NDLKSATSADDEDRVRQRQAIGLQRAANHFIDGIVPSDVLEDGDHRGAAIEKRRGVQSAGAAKDALSRAKRGRQISQLIRTDRESRSQPGQSARVNRVN